MTIASNPQIGDKTKYGTVFGGLSLDTGKRFYVLPEDAPLTMKWQEAIEYATTYEGFGFPSGTFRLPTKNELNQIFQNKAKIGGFNDDPKDFCPPEPRIIPENQEWGTSTLTKEQTEEFYKDWPLGLQYHEGRYWSSTEFKQMDLCGNDTPPSNETTVKDDGAEMFAWAQTFNPNGDQGIHNKRAFPASVRLVMD